MFKFKIKEITFISIMTALFMVSCILFVPFVMTSTQLGLQSLAFSFQLGLFFTIALRKVRKFSTIIFGGILSGLALLFVAPVMFFNQIFGAFLSEVLAISVFRSYKSNKAISLAAATFGLFTVPITGLVNILAKGRSIGYQIGDIFTFCLILVGVVVLGFLGSKFGHYLSNELEKAGKL